MNILIALLLLQHTCDVGTLNAFEKGWNLRIYNKNLSIDAAIRDYFSTKTRILSVSSHLPYTATWQYIINEYLTDVLKKTELMTFKLNVENADNTRNRPIFQYNLWYVDSYAAFKQLLPLYHNYLGNEVGHYMVVMNTAWHLQADVELQLIFEHAFLVNIANIVVAVYAKKSVFLLYSYDIFRPGECRQVVPRQVNAFRHAKFETAELFPYKFANFHKCPITLYNRYSVPFFTFNLSEDKRHIHQFGGIEAFLITTLAAKLNFDLKLYYRDSNFVGTVYENGTTTGPFLLLKEKSIDVLFGHYKYLARSRYFSATEGYIITPLVIVYHEHCKPIRLNKWLWQPFHHLVWLAIQIIICLAMLASCYLPYRCRKWQQNQKPHRPTYTITWLDVMASVLGQPIPLDGSDLAIRQITLSWVMGFMILSAIYQGKLYDAFNRFSPADDASVQQLLDNNYTFMFRQVVEHSIVKSLNIPQHSIHYVPNADDETIYDKMLQYPGNVATLTNYWQFQVYVSRRRLYSEFNLVPQIVVMNQVCAYMNQYSYLNEPISRIISALNAGGILKKWTGDAMIFDTSNTLNYVNDNAGSPEPIPLSMRKVRLVFMSLIVLHCVSFSVFVGEMVARRMTRKKLKSLCGAKCKRESRKCKRNCT